MFVYYLYVQKSLSPLLKTLYSKLHEKAVWSLFGVFVVKVVLAWLFSKLESKGLKGDFVFLYSQTNI